MIREALEHFQITPNLIENIMREISRLKPAAPPGGKPLVPWAIGVSTLAVVLLMLGIGNQQLSRFQKPYSFDATSEMTVDLIEAPVVLNLEAKPDIRTQLGDSAVPNKNDGTGQRSDDVLFAAAQTEGENVSIRKQQWIQAEPLKGSHVGGLSVTSDGELYTIANKHIYKMEPNGKEWQQITNIDTLNVNYRGRALIEKWNGTLYLLMNATLLASKDDGKTWELVHTLPVADFLFASDLELTKQAFYIIFSNYTAFRSEDTGKTWKAVTVEDGFPDRPSFMVALQGTTFTATDKELYRLKDNTWQRLKFPVPFPIKTGSVAVAKDRLYVMARGDWPIINPQRAWKEKPPTWKQPNWWIFRSTDLGDTWDDITPTNAWPVNGSPPNLKLIAAGETLLVMEQGMVRSTDSGNTWLPPQVPGTSPSMKIRNSAVVVNERTIYVDSQGNGLYRSIDGGISWDAVNINRQNRSPIHNLIAYKGSDTRQNMPPTLYATFKGEIVKTIDKGKSWKTVQMKMPMTVPVREKPPIFTQIRESGGSLYAKTSSSRNLSNPYKTGLCRISSDGKMVVPIPGMPIFDSQMLNYLWNKRKTGDLDVSDKLFVEQLKENFVGADQFFETLARTDTLRQDEIFRQQLFQEQNRLIRSGVLSGAFAVSGDTVYLEYNFKLFRWKPGETEWYDTGVEETGELLHTAAVRALFETKGLPQEKIREILGTWQEFTLAVSGDTVYVGKRDGHLVVSFDGGNNWLDLTPALPFPVKAFKDIVFARDMVYVATEAGVAASDNGKQWRAVTNAAGTRLNMEKLTVDGDTLYGLTKNTGIHRLESGTWEQVVSETPDHVETLAVDGNTLYVSTRDGNMLHFNLEK